MDKEVSMSKVWLITGASRGLGRAFTEEALKAEEQVMDRRKFIQTSTLTAAAMVTTSAARTARPRRSRKEGIEMKKSGAFWPNGARLVVSVSMQFEAGAQPERGAESPFPVIDTKYPD